MKSESITNKACTEVLRNFLLFCGKMLRSPHTVNVILMSRVSFYIRTYVTLLVYVCTLILIYV